MRNPRSPAALRRSSLSTLCAAVLALGPLSVHAAGDLATLAAGVLSLDPQVQALGTDPASDASLNLFIGSGRNELRLRKISLRIDQRPPQTYEYSEPEWEALAAGGLHPALSLALPSGSHRLQLELYARTLDAGPTDPRVVERLDQALALAPGATVLELSLEQGRLGGPALVQRDWSRGTPAGGEALQHPWLRAGDFWLAAQRPYLAARSLRRAGALGLPPGLHAEAEARVARGLEALDAPPLVDASADALLQRYNAASAALAAGDPLPLAALGKDEAVTPAAWMLRDRANLMLGYHCLRAGDGAGALQALGLVRSPGPYGNQALLGFGWAFLVRPGATTARSIAPGPANERPAFVVALDHAAANGGKERREALLRALVPWTELIGRDPLDPAAQEGALALAWALDQLDAGSQAHTYYLRSAEALEVARRELDAALQHVADGGLASAVGGGQLDPQSGWSPWLADLPYADGTGYLKGLLAEPVFVSALDRYRTARLLQAELEADAQPLSGASTADSRVASLMLGLASMRPAVDAAERSARTQLERTALDLLRAHKQRTERYLVEARFALARHYDVAPAADTATAPSRAAGATATGGGS